MDVVSPNPTVPWSWLPHRGDSPRPPMLRHVVGPGTGEGKGGQGGRHARPVHTHAYTHACARTHTASASPRPEGGMEGRTQRESRSRAAPQEAGTPSRAARSHLGARAGSQQNFEARAPVPEDGARGHRDGGQGQTGAVGKHRRSCGAGLGEMRSVSVVPVKSLALAFGTK